MNVQWAVPACNEHSSLTGSNSLQMLMMSLQTLGNIQGADASGYKLLSAYGTKLDMNKKAGASFYE